MSLLITRPYYDEGTHYLFYWSGELVKEAQNRGLKYFDLQKDKANRKTVQSYLEKQSPDLIIFNGHGDAICVMGDDKKPIISVSDNIYLLKNKKIFVRACSAGKLLGPEAIRVGATGFIGYKEPFWFLYDEEKFQRPLEDDLAKPFFECSNQVGFSLIKGHAIKEANDSSMKLYTKKISEMLSSKSINTYLIPFLMWNMANQICL